MMRRVLALLAVLSLFALAPPSRGEEVLELWEITDTYTPEELAALDRALHAANMTREDLTFRKDMTEGHACFEDVRALLTDPLRIAPWMDGFAGLVTRTTPIRHPAWTAVDRAGLEYPSEGGGWHGIEAFLGGRQVEHDAEALLDRLARLAGSPMPADALAKELGADDADLLRRSLPLGMDFHEVFDSPFRDERDEALVQAGKAKPDAWLHETALRISVPDHVRTWTQCFAKAGPWLEGLPPEVFPQDEPLVRETPSGRVALGTPKDDVYEGDFAVLIDPGGNDRYVGCRLGSAYGTAGHRVGFFADLGGDDVYDCGDVNLTLGAAVLGIAAFFDLGAGNDRYVGGHGSLGAAMGGVAVFYDDGGSDVYEGKTFTQGAAGFGIGVFYDDAVQARPTVTTDEGTEDPVEIALFDNDRLSAWANAQAFARCRGVALCINVRGNDVYEAGGVYLHAPLFADRYQSFSQGFAIGERGIDYAGGIAMLIDYDGNDRYLGDIYNQGVGYWYSAGLLWDGGGNDTYEMTQYGQGSGIHLAVGGLVDVSGNDTYVMHSGLGQGGSHDYAASILHDRGGNDRYMGNTSCNGSALTNSVGLQIDRSGDDLYAGRSSGSINFGRPARGFDSIGVLLDLGGKDDYLGIMKDDTSWRHTHLGVGIDEASAPADTTGEGVTPAADQPTGRAEVPDVCSYEGELTQEVFDELWAIAIRWEVGDNRLIVPKARQRLIAFGTAILPMLDEKMEEDASGLELRAYVDVLKGLGEQDADAVAGLLARNLESPVERRKRVALYLVGELKVVSLEHDVVALLAGDDEGLQLRAAGVLASLGSHAGDEALKGWLAPEEDERKIQTALGTLLGLGSDVYPQVRPLLDHPLMSVRTRLVALLVAHADLYLDAVRADLAAVDLSDRARRTVLDVLAKTNPAHDASDQLVLQVLLEHRDWGMRADAVRWLRRWADEGDPWAKARLGELLQTERDPYVLFCARGED